MWQCGLNRVKSILGRFHHHQHFMCRFYACRSQKRKKYSIVLGLLGSARVKAARKMLVKWTPCRYRTSLKVNFSFQTAATPSGPCIHLARQFVRMKSGTGSADDSARTQCLRTGDQTAPVWVRIVKRCQFHLQFYEQLVQKQVPKDTDTDDLIAF